MTMRLALAIALLLGNLAMPLTARAANDTMEGALLITGANPGVGDTLVGNSGGAFRWFRIDYLGGGRPVPISMRAQPGRGTGGVATGFKLYGPSGLIGDAVGDDRSTSDSGYAFTLAHVTPGPYYIQVYNFVQGLALNFQLNVSGLPAPSAPAPAPPPEEGAAPVQGAPVDPPPAPPGPAAPAVPFVTPNNSSGDRPVVATGTTFTSGGTLAGKAGGSFHYFALDYPGGRTNMSITVGYSPITGESSKGVGFNLYRPDPSVKEGAVVVGFASETGRNESSATTGFTYSGDAAERFLLQVLNYLPNTTINYTLIVTGLAGPVVEVGDISDPGKAFVLSLSNPAAVGHLPGDRSGRFHHFLLQYPGGDREVRITATTESNARIGDGEFGLNVYKGADNVGTARGHLDDKSRRTATLTIRQLDGQTFGIQIYNYSAGAQADYAITVSGL